MSSNIALSLRRRPYRAVGVYFVRLRRAVGRYGHVARHRRVLPLGYSPVSLLDSTLYSAPEEGRKCVGTHKTVLYSRARGLLTSSRALKR